MVAEALTALVAASSPGLAGWAPSTKAANAFADGRRGTVTFAVRTERELWSRGADRVAPSASVLKAILLVTHLRAARSRALTAKDRALLAPMIRRSANEPASELVARYGARHVEWVARRGGMRRFRLRSPWGSSEVTARDLTRFALAMEDLMPARHRSYGMELLRTVVPSQRWGVAARPPSGWTLYFKSGWGSGTGRVDTQVALLERGNDRVAVAMLATAQGDHTYGRRTLGGIARRLLAKL